MNNISKVHIMSTGEFVYSARSRRKGHYFPITWNNQYSIFRGVWWSLYVDEDDPFLENTCIVLHEISSVLRGPVK